MGRLFLTRRYYRSLLNRFRSYRSRDRESNQKKSSSMDRTCVRVKTYKPKPSHFLPEVDSCHCPGLFSTSLGFTSYPHSPRSVLILWDSLSFTRQTMRSTCIQEHSLTSQLSPYTVITAHQRRYRGSMTQQLVWLHILLLSSNGKQLSTSLL